MRVGFATLLVGCGFSPAAIVVGADARVDPGAIAVDMQSSAATSSSATLSWSHAVGAGLDRSVLVVGVSVEKSSGASVQSITFAGSALTKAVAASGGGGVKAELWYVTAPAAGANEVVVTFTTTLGSDGAIGGAVSLSGVDQATPVATTQTNGGVGMPSTTITTVNDHAWLIDTIMIDNPDPVTAKTTGEQGQWTTAQGSKIRGAGSTLATATHGTSAMSWQSMSDNWAQVVAELKP
jgi:hypothetical protein